MTEHPAPFDQLGDAGEPALEREPVPDLRDAVRDALDAMHWLGPSDEALRVLALRQADEIEKAVERAAEYDSLCAAIGSTDIATRKRLQKLEAQCDLTKAVGWLGPQLQGVIRDLGGTPAARKAMSPDKPIGGRLAQLRAAAGEHDS